MMLYHQKERDGNVGWNYQSWLQRFNVRSKDPYHYRDLRRDVYQSTIDIVLEGRYLSVSGVNVSLDVEAITLSQEQTIFYPDTRKICSPKLASDHKTMIYAIEADCLETDRLLQKAGLNTAVLNMASNVSPGGGVIAGSGAQEENLFRRSAAFTSLYQFVDYGATFGVARNPQFSYPIPKEAGGIYSPKLCVFRSSERTGYFLLDTPYYINMISVAAISNPPLVEMDGSLFIADALVEPTKEKIRAILRIGYAHKHDALILSAFGCGAFANPPRHMAELFHEVLSENEFNGVFRLIVFAIIDDHNTHKEHNPLGNLIPFQQVFHDDFKPSRV